jgi:hypothetical protein
MHSKIFKQLRKVKIICKTAMLCKKMKNEYGVNDPAHPLKGISIKNLYVPELSYPNTLQKYRNLTGLPNNKFLRSKIDLITANSKQN